MQADTIDNGTETMRFRRSNNETVEIEAVYRPGAPRPPAGFHPRQEERIDVVRGALAVEMAGERCVLRAGESITIPRHVPHQVACAGDEEAHAVLTLRPGLRTEAFFRAVFALSRDGKLRPSSPAALARFAAIAREFRDEFVLAGPPRLVQTILFGALAPLGRLLIGSRRSERCDCST
jgi:quercetin dioxygenase-like cupin family protein